MRRAPTIGKSRQATARRRSLGHAGRWKSQVRGQLRHPEIAAGTWLAARVEALHLTKIEVWDARERLDLGRGELFPAEQVRIVWAQVEG
jgi:hypothetical protein